MGAEGMSPGGRAPGPCSGHDDSVWEKCSHEVFHDPASMACICRGMALVPLCIRFFLCYHLSGILPICNQERLHMAEGGHSGRKHRPVPCTAIRQTSGHASAYRYSAAGFPAENSLSGAQAQSWQMRDIFQTGIPLLTVRIPFPIAAAGRKELRECIRP